MIKLYDNNIFVGQIKQLLHTFNLPTCDIGENNKQPNRHYINNLDSSIYYYSIKDTVETTKFCCPYIYGSRYDNLSTTLNIENSIYDRYTHRYLGKYLRFIDKFYNINLMSMYNIFDGETFNDVINDIGFNVDVNNFICYKAPIIKNDYTIYLKSLLEVDVCVSFTDVPSIPDNIRIVSAFINGTHKKLKINKPVLLNLKELIDTLLQVEENKKFYDKYKQNMCLLLKVPFSYKGPITILEGDYTKNYYNTKDGFIYKTEGDKKLECSGFYITPQLFSYTNNNVNNLLADRLVEFLTDNAISTVSESYDIKKIQVFLKNHKYGIGKYWGIWTDAETVAIKDFCIKNGLTGKNDLTGFVDSDVELMMNSIANKNKEEGIV